MATIRNFTWHFPRVKRVENVHSPLYEGPWGEYGVKLFLLLMDEVAMLLAGYALFDKGVAVCLHSWPKVASAEDFGGHVRAPE